MYIVGVSVGSLVFLCFAAFGYVFLVLAERLAGKSIGIMTNFVLVGCTTLNESFNFVII